MGRQYNANHIGNSRRYQIQETCWYEISIGGMGEDITFMCQSVTLPELTNPAIRVGYGNSEAKIAGRREVGAAAVRILDAPVADIEAQITGWQGQIYDPATGKMGWVDEYKRQMTVTQYGPDGTYNRTWKYTGVWPSSINFGNMDSEGTDKKVMQLTLEYDNAERLPVSQV